MHEICSKLLFTSGQGSFASEELPGEGHRHRDSAEAKLMLFVCAQAFQLQSPSARTPLSVSQFLDRINREVDDLGLITFHRSMDKIQYCYHFYGREKDQHLTCCWRNYLRLAASAKRRRLNSALQLFPC